MISETKDHTFEHDILMSDLPVMVDFWADGCRPCQIASLVLEKVAIKFNNRIKIYKLNVNENTKTALKYVITGVPTFLVFVKGSVVEQIVGSQREEVYCKILEEVLNRQL
jgi:thioredoxin 1